VWWGKDESNEKSAQKENNWMKRWFYPFSDLKSFWSYVRIAKAPHGLKILKQRIILTVMEEYSNVSFHSKIISPCSVSKSNAQNTSESGLHIIDHNY
jgi:hypothetical protein